MFPLESFCGTRRYSYDGMGRLREKVLPDGIQTSYGLDVMGRLESLTHTKSGDILDAFQYSYDPAGNITEIEKHRAGVEVDSGLFSYGYDRVGRLISAAHGDMQKRYVYDSLGNRVTSMQNGVETRYSYNARNQLIRLQAGEEVTEYRYDGRGNMVQTLVNGVSSAEFAFDATNRMTYAVTGKGSAQYTYNGFLSRVGKLEKCANIPNPESEVRYTLDMTLPYDNLLMMRDSRKEQSFVWGNGLVSSIGDERFHYLQDHLGSPVRLLGENGLQDALAFDEFGVVTAASQKAANPFGFTGYQRDDVSGLWFAQARYYVPQVGRFSSEDIIKGAIAYPFTLNSYIYCWNRPLKFVDLDGLIPTPMEAARMAQEVYNIPKDASEYSWSYNGWQFESVTRDGNNMVMGVYSKTENGVTEYALVNKGTTPTSLNDWKNNVQQPVGRSPDVTASIAAAIAFVEANKDIEVTMIGHSKGAAEAAINAVITNMNAILFNPATANLNAYGANISNYTGDMTAFIVRGDILNSIFGPISRPIGEVVPLPHQYGLKIGPFVMTNEISGIRNHLMKAVIAALMEAGYCE